jgi:hypothetical protein
VFEILEVWKYFGEALCNKALRAKKLRGNEFGEINTAPS